MDKHSILAYVEEHAESQEDASWIAGQLISNGIKGAFQQAIDTMNEAKQRR